MSDKPISINLGGLIRPQTERTPGQKNKTLPKQSVFSVPDEWDGLAAWVLTWVSIGGLFVSFSRFVLWVSWPPITIPIAAIAGLILFVFEVWRHPAPSVGMALGLILVGCILGVLH